MASSEDQSPDKEYGLSCPSGGSFYICTSSQVRFLGCCETDPCSNGGECGADALRPASYVSYPGSHQSCAAPYDEGDWYTCDFATPKFMGCCTRDPCNEGCPDENLVPARLDDDDSIAAPFLLPPSSSSESSIITTFSSSTSSSGTSSSSTSATLQTPSGTETGVSEGPSTGETAKEPPQTPTSKPTGLIVGLTMMGIVVLLIIIGILIWWRKRGNIWEFRNRIRRRSGSSRNDNEDHNEKTTAESASQTGELLCSTNPPSSQLSRYLDTTRGCTSS
ncbi:hypothetical protein F5Y05DRAFT_378588 [Hypoxylon sp. FL0543]|nr:hypothetical protein F5Y05DRAFT_378588 [Hypoxylon sp. FL0543]